ncbi:hypothetical protein DPMN_107772, partial [Dreissena polymorpha]
MSGFSNNNSQRGHFPDVSISTQSSGSNPRLIHIDIPVTTLSSDYSDYESKNSSQLNANSRFPVYAFILSAAVVVPAFAVITRSLHQLCRRKVKA